MEPKYVLIFSTTFVDNTFNFKKNEERNYPSFLTDFNKTSFTLQIFEKNSNLKFQEIFPVAAVVFHEDGRTNTMKLIVTF